jgi:hypothetical protein
VPIRSSRTGSPKRLDPWNALPLPTNAGRYSVDARPRSIVAVDFSHK